jgi:pimeloyl-ACP methyl ester carboxylesterase
MEEKLQLRIYGDASRERALPTLVYLPGMHGDWTLIGGFRSRVLGRVRFVEMTYPRATAGSLDDYAAQIEDALAQNGISRGWLLGESFGSQLAWALLARGKFQAQGVILAGGFVRHPAHRFMRLMEKFTGVVSGRIFVKVVFGYAKFSRYRYRDSPETLASLDEFIARRSPSDKQAAQYRLHLVARYDPRPIARNAQVPVYGLAGFLDPIVPWPPVRRWLKWYCPALRDFKVIRRADHNVLNTGIRESAQWVLEWMGALPVDDSPERAKIKATS